MIDREYMLIIIGVVVVVIVLGFFGYKNYDRGQHQHHVSEVRTMASEFVMDCYLPGSFVNTKR
jgi:uncharacterized protein (UPF0333 family)